MSLHKPTAKKQTLLLISGLLWSTVGLLLNSFAIRWLLLFSLAEVALLIITGILVALIITFFGFSKLAANNIARINIYPSEVCVFAFQEWQSYLIAIVMMSLGIFLRSNNFVPRFILTPMYIGIGTALFFSSFKYYKSYFVGKI